MFDLVSILTSISLAAHGVIPDHLADLLRQLPDVIKVGSDEEYAPDDGGPTRQNDSLGASAR